MIDGKKISTDIQNTLRERVCACGRVPRMDIISLSRDRVITSFVRMKRKFGETIGVDVRVHELPEDMDQADLVSLVEGVVGETNGCIIQLPLPPHIDTDKILNLVPWEKDIDVLGREAQERFGAGEMDILPPVPGAVAAVLAVLPPKTRSKKFLIIGSGKLVGSPVATLLGNMNINFDIIDRDTPDEERKKRLLEAEVVISGTGQPHSIRSEDIRKGVILIDAGTSELAKKMVGDIDPVCYAKASYYTPVPGGIGPITIAILFKNLIAHSCI